MVYLLENLEVALSGCTVARNVGIGDGSGGGINSFKSTLTLTDCTVSGNTNSRGGGNACGFSNTTITNCLIENNIATEQGGGIYDSGTGSSLSIIDSRITGNSAIYQSGGGIHCSATASLTITNTSIDNNHALNEIQGAGGGISCLLTSGTIKDSNISGNTARTGGGIYLSHSSPMLTNCLLAENAAGEAGGAVAAEYYSTPSFTNCTMSRNSAVSAGGGLYAHYSAENLTMLNCIMSENAASVGSNVALASDYIPSSLSMSHSDIHGGAATVLVEPDCEALVGDGVINARPLFAEGPLGSYYLSHRQARQSITSPCVDAGSDTAYNLGLDQCTTRTDQIADSGMVDMGYHYSIKDIPALTRIELNTPADGSALTNPPTFEWTADGGGFNVYSIEFSFSPGFATFWATYNDLHEVIYDNGWTMPDSFWNQISSGRTVYWRVRGVDLYRQPLTSIVSHEFSFMKD